MFASNMIEFVQKESVRIIDITQVTKMMTQMMMMMTMIMMMART